MRSIKLKNAIIQIMQILNAFQIYIYKANDQISIRKKKILKNFSIKHSVFHSDENLKVSGIIHVFVSLQIYGLCLVLRPTEELEDTVRL